MKYFLLVLCLIAAVSFGSNRQNLSSDFTKNNSVILDGTGNVTDAFNNVNASLTSIISSIYWQRNNNEITQKETDDILVLNFGNTDKMKFGSSGAFSSFEMRHYANDSAFIMGALRADGDEVTRASEGIRIYGKNFDDDDMDNSNWARAVIKATQLGLENADSVDGQEFIFTVNTNELAYANANGTNRFSINRLTGLITAGGDVDIDGNNILNWAHTANSNAHHPPYTDAEAITALAPHTGNLNVHFLEPSHGNYFFDGDVFRKETAADMILLSNGNNKDMSFWVSVNEVATEVLSIDTTSFPFPAVRVKAGNVFNIQFSNANWHWIQMEDQSERADSFIQNFGTGENVRRLMNPFSTYGEYDFSWEGKNSSGEISELFYVASPASGKGELFLLAIDSGESETPSELVISAFSSGTPTPVARIMGNTNESGIFTPGNFIFEDHKAYTNTNAAPTHDQEIHNKLYTDNQDTLLLLLAGGTMSGNLWTTAGVFPVNDNVNSLGSPSKRWKSVHVGPGSVHIGNVTLSDKDGHLGANHFHAEGNANAGTAGYFRVKQGSAPTGLEAGHIKLWANNNKLFLQDPDGTDLLMVKEDSSGNVGIGTDSPTALLDVNGAARVRGSMSIDVALTVDNDIEVAGHPLTPSYGELYENTPGGTAIALTNANEDYQWVSSTVGEERGIGYVVGSAATDNLGIGSDGDGLYRCSLTGAFSGSINTTFHVRILRDGVLVSNKLECHREISATANVGPCPILGTVRLSNTNSVTVVFRSDDASKSVAVEHMILFCERIAN